MPVPTVNQEKKHRFLRSIVWTVFTLALVLPLTFFLAPIWLCIQTLEAYLPILRDVNVFMEKLLTWPRLMGVAIYEGSENFPNPLMEEDAALIA